MQLDLHRADGAIRLRQPAARRERWAWYLYDFGNSAYAAVILLAVYSAYFKQQVVGGAEGSRLWGLSVGIAMLVVALISPVFGALADFSATKKRLLFGCTVMACVFTAALFFVQPGNIFAGMLFFILAEIGYRGGQVFYNALLPEIAEPHEMGHVSGTGWALGSLGGIICLLIVLSLITGIGGGFVIRLSFLITAAFYALATAPIFFLVRERAIPQPMPPGENYLSVSFKKLWRTFLSARDYKEFIKFQLAFLLYNNGIMITLDFAAIIGATLFGMQQQQLIVFMIIVQITSVIGAYLFGIITDKLGGKASLVIALAAMIGVALTLVWVDSLMAFNIIGALAGFALTGVQSVSRTVVGQITPVEKSAEFYGLYSVAGLISGFTGPALYGVLAAALAMRFQNQGLAPVLAEQTGMRAAVFGIVAFLVVGTVMLLTVKSWNRGKSANG